MATSRLQTRWWILATIGLLLIFAVSWIARNSLRHYAAHHAETIEVRTDSYNRKAMTTLRSNTGLVFLAKVVCSDDYLLDEYRRTNDIRVFALQQLIYRGGLSSKDCEDEIRNGAIGFTDLD